MSIIGIGSKLAALTVLYSFFLITINNYYSDVFKINIAPPLFLFILSSVLIACGLSFLLISIFAVNRAYRTDHLCVDGPYSVCRNPLYSAWIIFIVPGIVLFFNSWILLSIPFAMYIFFRLLIKEEDNYLSDKFGKTYTDYKNTVSLLFPRFWKYAKIKNY